MFESMQRELLSLAEYLQRITVYEDLYGDSQEMQRLFFNSYINIIHFWHRVHKECKYKGTLPSVTLWPSVLTVVQLSSRSAEL